MNKNEYIGWFNGQYKKTSSFFSGAALMSIDIISIMFCIGLAFFLVNAVDKTLINFKSFIIYSAYLPLFLVVFYVFNLYPGIMLPPAEEVRRFCIASAICFGGLGVSIIFESDIKDGVAIAFFIAIPFALFILPLFREIGRKLYSKMQWWGIPAVIYCSDEKGKLIVNRLMDNGQLGYRPVLIINENNIFDTSYRNVPVMTKLSEALEAAKQVNIKMVIIIEPKNQILDDDTPYAQIFSHFRYNTIIPQSQKLTVSTSISDFGGILGYATTHNLTKSFNLFIKRCIDLLLLIVAFPFVLPIMIIISLLIKLSSTGPIFYGHTRLGKGGKLFKAWKFRSMIQNADVRLKELLVQDEKLRTEWDQYQKLSNDPRITSIGKFLRKTSLDELPQLWNILKGDMSFIGPRPIVRDEVAKYGNKFEYIFSAVPGLSGMWQISGRSDTGYDERIQLDSYYLQNWSIWLDIWIIIKTFGVVFRKKGAY